MENFKERWEITKNWQFIHIVLGLIATFFSAYLISRGLLKLFIDTSHSYYIFALLILIAAISYLIIKITLWLFTKLYDRWGVTYRWELVAMFLVFAITGSTSGRLSDPLMELIGLDKTAINAWIYWPIRILLIFPLYQVLLVFFGWIFGQFAFFKAFAIKMVSRLGLGFLFST